MADIKTKAEAVFQTLSPAARSQHEAAWARIVRHIHTVASIHEIHPATTNARNRYFAEVAKGLPADLAERSVMAAYKA